MPIFTLQRDEKYFGMPKDFIPERWVEGCAEEQSLNRHVPGSWMAFGEGTRVCVGQRFALVEAKITLAKLFRKYAASPCCLLCDFLLSSQVRLLALWQSHCRMTPDLGHNDSLTHDRTW